MADITLHSPRHEPRNGGMFQILGTVFACYRWAFDVLRVYNAAGPEALTVELVNRLPVRDHRI